VIGVVGGRAANIIHKGRFGWADIIDNQFCYR
jgi:hypothetical protein